MSDLRQMMKERRAETSKPIKPASKQLMPPPQIKKLVKAEVKIVPEVKPKEEEPKEVKEVKITPAGFFDDDVKDYKARGKDLVAEMKNEIDADWKEFENFIAEHTDEKEEERMEKEEEEEREMQLLYEQEEYKKRVDNIKVAKVGVKRDREEDDDENEKVNNEIRGEDEEKEEGPLVIEKEDLKAILIEKKKSLKLKKQKIKNEEDDDIIDMNVMQTSWRAKG